MFNTQKDTTTQIVEMNIAFGNAAGNFDAFDFEVANAELKNMRDELNELQEAINSQDVEGVRDALCDVQVFAVGAQHKLGLNPQQDMQAVINGVMTRFVKDKADLESTIAFHAKRGIKDVSISGEYPRVVVRSTKDQPDAPKGKFLKSASYSKTIFDYPSFNKNTRFVLRVGSKVNKFLQEKISDLFCAFKI